MSLSVTERRERVAYYLVQGLTEIEIANKIGTSRRTIVRDVYFIKQAAQKWVNSLAMGEFVFQVKLAMDKLIDTELQLRHLLSMANTIEEKLKILKAIQDNVALRIQLLGEGPTLLSLNKIVKGHSEKTKEESN